MENPNEFDGEINIDLRLLLVMARQWSWLIILMVLLSAGLAYFISGRMTPVYQASTMILINEAPMTKTTDYAAIQTSERLARTYTELMKNRTVLEGVISQLGLDLSTTALAELISVTQVQSTQLILVKVDGSNPDQAALIANTLFDVFSEKVQTTQAERYSASKESLNTQMTSLQTNIQELKDQLSKTSVSGEQDRLESKISQYEQSYNNLALSYEQVRLMEAQTVSNAVQIEPAIAPVEPFRPDFKRNIVIAAVMGFILAVGGVILAETLNDSVKGPEDITRQLKIPILAMIGNNKLETEEPVTKSHPRSSMAESFRVLRTNVAYASVDKPIYSLLVTSPTPGDGKSTIAVNLAIVFAQSGQRVTLIDADLHKPRLHSILGIHNRMGLSNLFVKAEIDFKEVQRTFVENLFAIPTGPIPPNPSELLGSRKMIDILQRLKTQTELVVIDCPPVLAVTDAAVLAPRVDGVLVVVRPGTTTMNALKQMVEQLHQVGANIIGVVLNQVDGKRAPYNYYFRNYKYYQEYQDGDPNPNKGRRNGSKFPEGLSTAHVPRSVKVE